MTDLNTGDNAFKRRIDSVRNIRSTDERLAALAELADSLLSEKTRNISKTIKEYLYGQIKKTLSGRKGFIGLAQVNPVSGDIAFNGQKIARYIRYAESIGLDAIVFPELALIGYPIEDVIDRHPVIVTENVQWLKQLAELTVNTTALVGFIEPRKNAVSGRKYYNAVAVLHNGKIQSIIRKRLLPTYSEFNDCRYIEPSPVAGAQPGKTLGDFSLKKGVSGKKTNEINGISYGISICEDCWNNKNFFRHTLYEADPVDELARDNPDVFINCSASPSRAKKEQLKHNMLSFIARQYAVPFVYVNQVGAIDNCSFEGASRVFNADGSLLARAKSFEEQCLIVNPVEKIGKIYPLTKGLEKTLKEEKTFTLDYENDLERTYKTIVQAIRDYFEKCGLKRAVLGLSGGLDSTVCAVLLADALGKENVFGISMPSEITSAESRNDAAELAHNLGIHFMQMPIGKIVDAANVCLSELFSGIERIWDCRYKTVSFTQDNIQARARAVLLWGISNEFEACIPIATSDKSELYMGYATVNGDMSGGFAPIADVPKTKLFALARWLNKNRAEKNAVPEAVILKKPGAELAIDPKTGKPLTAEDALMPYPFLDEVIWRIENKHESYTDMLRSEFLYERGNTLSAEQKTAWLDKFYKRMAGALYKWSILPPSVIVEARSINKNDYRQPVTSGRIDYKGKTENEIRFLLKRQSS